MVERDGPPYDGSVDHLWDSRPVKKSIGAQQNRIGKGSIGGTVKISLSAVFIDGKPKWGNLMRLTEDSQPYHSADSPLSKNRLPLLDKIHFTLDRNP